MIKKYDVTGMTCSACSTSVHKAVSKLDGVKDINVNLLTNSMSVDVQDGIQDAAIIKAVQKAGYDAKAAGQKASQAQATAKPDGKSNQDEQTDQVKKRIIVSVAFLLPLMYVAMGHMVGAPLPGFLHGYHNAVSFVFLQFLLVLPVVYVNRNYYIGGFKSLLRGNPNMDTLIAVGSSAAMFYGVYSLFRISSALGGGDMATVAQYADNLYFESVSMILTLITVGKYLESRSKGRTGDAISKLLKLRPDTATIEVDGVEIQIPYGDIKQGDIVVVRPGESIPVDGVVTYGSTAIDQSSLTGESIPVDKTVGDKVMAATANKNGFIKLVAEKVGADTTLSKIIELVEEAASSKAPIAALADKISGIFVPIVIGISLVSGIAWLIAGYGFDFALNIAIAVLVISCPCALGLATPVAVMVGTGRGAAEGILIKSAAALQTAHSIDIVVLDKTGTVTEGKPSVTDIFTLLPSDELLRLTAAVERMSEHPLSKAIVDEANNRGLDIPQAADFAAVTGRGVYASVGSQKIYAGNAAFMADIGADTQEYTAKAQQLAADGKTPLYIADGGQVMGIIAVADKLKESSVQAVASLIDAGMEVILLTGDNKNTADAIARSLGGIQVIADVLPDGKEQQISALRASGKKVAMVGDGINDSPALAAADVGIAIGAGSDIAIESADIVLMKSDLRDAVTAIKLSKATLRNIKENLFWAFFYNVLCIPLAAGALYTAAGLRLNPMIAAAAMSVSSLFVVSNALRLRFFKPQSRKTPHSRNNLQYRKNLQSDNNPQFGNNPQSILDRENNQEANPNKEDIMQKTITVEGMTCNHCKMRVEKALAAVKGVQSATVDLQQKQALITFAKEIADKKIRAAIEDAGYTVISIQ